MGDLQFRMIMVGRTIAAVRLRFAGPPLQNQNIYFSATWISRMFVRVERILPKAGELLVTSGLPQFG